jgi:hypothetical protein
MGIDLEFMFDGLPVGCFEEAAYPSAPGRYRYMPYRGAGHYFMHQKRRESGAAHCTYECGGRRVSFVVIDCPEYGVLELRDFAEAPSA